MKFTVKTIMVATALMMLFAPVQAAELESGFLGTKWAIPAKELKGFTKDENILLLHAHRQTGQRGNEKELGG